MCKPALRTRHLMPAVDHALLDPWQTALGKRCRRYAELRDTTGEMTGFLDGPIEARQLGAYTGAVV
jgi:hypothetical protein